LLSLFDFNEMLASASGHVRRFGCDSVAAAHRQTAAVAADIRQFSVGPEAVIRGGCSTAENVSSAPYGECFQIRVADLGMVLAVGGKIVVDPEML
jgi:hypothetical protein